MISTTRVNEVSAPRKPYLCQGRRSFVLCTNPLSLGSSLKVAVAWPTLLKESRTDGSSSSSGKPVGTENRGLYEILRLCSGFCNNFWCSHTTEASPPEHAGTNWNPVAIRILQPIFISGRFIRSRFQFSVGVPEISW